MYRDRERPHGQANSRPVAHEACQDTSFQNKGKGGAPSDADAVTQRQTPTSLTCAQLVPKHMPLIRSHTSVRTRLSPPSCQKASSRKKSRQKRSRRAPASSRHQKVIIRRHDYGQNIKDPFPNPSGDVQSGGIYEDKSWTFPT